MKKVEPTMEEKIELLKRIEAGEVDVKDDGTIKTLGRGPTVEPEYIHSYKEWTERFPDHTPAISIHPQGQLIHERDRLKELLESTAAQLKRTQDERDKLQGRMIQIRECVEKSIEPWKDSNTSDTLLPWLVALKRDYLDSDLPEVVRARIDHMLSIELPDNKSPREYWKYEDELIIIVAPREPETYREHLRRKRSERKKP